MKVVAVIVLVAVLFVLIAPVVNLGPAARLVRAGHALRNVLVLLPPTLPCNIPLVGRLEFQSLDIMARESHPVSPIFTRDCVLLC